MGNDNNILNTIRQGEHDARAKARAKRRGVKAGGGGGKSSTKSGGAGRSRGSLRAAAARGGRGISIQNQKTSGRGFRDLIDYATDPSKNPQIVFSNCGTDPQDVLKTMLRCAELRPDILNKVGHITLSLPPSNGRGEERWEQIVDELRAQIGLDDAHPCIAVRHNDTEHDHIHLIYSRVSVDGRVHDQRNIGLRCAAAEPVIESKFNLPMTPASEFKSRGNILKNEIELGVRTQQKPARLQIADALKIATQGKPTPQQFVERLNSAKIGVKASVSPSTGKMSGFSFSFDGIAFSGSKIDKKYGWKALEKEINYDQTRDSEFLAGLDGTTGTASADAARAVATIDALDRAVAAVHTATPDIPTNRIDNPPVVDRAGQSPGRTAEKATRTTDRRDTKKPPIVIVAAPVELDRIMISPPDLKTAAWQRSARLLDEYRRAIKNKTDIVELDRLASEAGHAPSDIISAHATTTDKLPAQVAQDVLKNAPSDAMREYIQKEFEESKKRLKAQKSENKTSDSPAPVPR